LLRFLALLRDRSPAATFLHRFVLLGQHVAAVAAFFAYFPRAFCYASPFPSVSFAAFAPFRVARGDITEGRWRRRRVLFALTTVRAWAARRRSSFWVIFSRIFSFVPPAPRSAYGRLQNSLNRQTGRASRTGDGEPVRGRATRERRATAAEDRRSTPATSTAPGRLDGMAWRMDTIRCGVARAVCEKTPLPAAARFCARSAQTFAWA